MVRGVTSLPAGNRLLDSLDDDDRRRLTHEVEAVRFKLMENLYVAGEGIDHVYFPLQSAVSILTRAHGTSGVEVATVGNEGVVGLSLAWGAAQLNPAEVLRVQVPGPALRMPAAAFTAELARDAGLAGVVRRYTQAFVTQLMQQVACNGLHSIEERCARWMLLTHDRIGADEFPLTHELLAQMLGVRRASVTVVAGTLQNAGFIHYRRGRVTVTDRAGLEGVACECYGVLRGVFERVVPLVVPK
jgi:CRP-like cAMP-binding protein